MSALETPRVRAAASIGESLPAGGRHADHAPVGTVGAVIAVERPPQRHERQEQVVAAFGLRHAGQQIEGGDACDGAVLEVQAVGQLGEAGVQGLLQRQQLEAGARRVPAVADRRERTRLGFGLIDRCAHDLNGAGLDGGKAGYVAAARCPSPACARLATYSLCQL